MSVSYGGSTAGFDAAAQRKCQLFELERATEPVEIDTVADAVKHRGVHSRGIRERGTEPADLLGADDPQPVELGLTIMHRDLDLCGQTADRGMPDGGDVDKLLARHR